MRKVNVEGVIHATRAVMGGMRERRYAVARPMPRAPPVTSAT